MRMKTKNEEYVSVEQEGSVIMRLVCVHHYVAAARAVPSAGHLNDLVGSEMCHKGALMDEGEHGANDPTAAARPRSHLMTGLTPDADAFSGVFHRRAGSRRAAWESLHVASSGRRLVRRTSRRCEEHASERKRRKMPAFGDLIEKMSNGPRYPAQFIPLSGLVL